MTFVELQDAVVVLGISDRFSLRELKQRYRLLMKRHHPDVAGDADAERARRITAAYRLLCNYIETYQFTMTEDEFLQHNPEERLRRQFAGDPLWAGR